MPRATARPEARFIQGTALLVFLLSAGCGDGVERHPVAGKVLVDGKPLRGKAGSVLFKPDPSKGGASPLEAAGTIDEEGGYTLYSAGRKGAPQGRYKVVVFVTEKGADRETKPPRLFHARYGNEKTTPLTVEVVAGPAPDQYDLKLTKK